MALDAAALAVQLAFTVSKAVTGFESLEHTDAKSYRLTPDTATYSLLLAKRYTVAGGASQTVDLRSFTDFYGDAKVMGGCLLLLVLPTVTSGGCKVEPGDSNALTWFFSGTTPAVTVPTGGVLVFGQPTSQTVDATHCTLKFTNTHGTNAMTLDLLVVGKP